MTGKNPDRHWKTTDYKILTQLNRLEIEQAYLLKTFDGYRADVNRCVFAKRAYQCFFET